MAGIYIHIPFCKQACHYCDFHFSTNQNSRNELTMAIADELSIQKNYLEGDPINTIYFGGGTPSILTIDEIKSILDSARQNFDVLMHTEITLEANPDDLTTEKLLMLKEVGVNRLSIGIQSFDDSVLKFLNRAHTGYSAMQCVNEARIAGFNNISLDLIYAIPGQDDDAWRKNIKQVVALNPEHISSYSLTIEEKTTFGRWSAQGKLKAADDEIAASQLEILMQELEDMGYEHYEISNFSRPTFQSRHNSNYWRQEKYLGVGPSAHSYNGDSRQFNISNNNLYLQSLKDGVIPFEMEILSPEDKTNEYLLTTLRTSWGSDLQKLKNEFGYDVQEIHKNYLDTLHAKKLVEIDHGALKLTKAGKLLADKIASDLFLLK
jgi:oxygen-independent coproporphyrinogen-3 oxidase